MKFNVVIGLAFVGTLSAMPYVHAADDHHSDHSRTHEGASHKAHGVVNSVDAASGKVNISHDPIQSLNWPKMKMDFQAHDRALLKRIKPGVTVDFEVQKMGNEYHITKITPAH